MKTSDLLIHGGASQKRNLVIATVGDTSKHPSWISSPAKRQFDLMLIYYGDDPQFDLSGAEYAIRRKGFKYPLLHHVISQMSKIIEEYEAIWCPDDDILTDTVAINRLFELFHQHQLLLAQPAIASGECSYDSLRQVPDTVLRFTPYVEIMCPIFHRSALFQLHELMSLTSSGWGIDWLWSTRFTPKKVAIIDAVGVHHTGKLMRGDLYQKLKARGIDPRAEFFGLMRKFGGFNRRIYKKMLRGTMPMNRIPEANCKIGLWEHMTRRWRWGFC